MKLIIVSGRSGSGKSTALHQLEDLGYYCVDNLPAGLLPALTEQLEGAQYQDFLGVAVCIDARNSEQDLIQLIDVIDNLPDTIHCEVIYLDAADPILATRFSETRRPHPLRDECQSLAEAIEREALLLDGLSSQATLSIDTSKLNLYDLRATISQRVGVESPTGLSLLIESFGFKKGLPADADLVFDARHLPNPHWVPELRSLTGEDQAVANFLQSQPETCAYIDDISAFLLKWLPAYARSQRSYVSVAIGCTGGQHRSVYIANQVFLAVSEQHDAAQLRHRELTKMASQ